jgi:hypothetical protein
MKLEAAGGSTPAASFNELYINFLPFTESGFYDRIMVILFFNQLLVDSYQIHKHKKEEC